jgi:hypothetical protein
MMQGPEKSDPVIVAGKPANKAGEPPAERSAEEPNAAELVEPRACPWLEQGAGTKGNASQQSRCRTQRRASLLQELERIRQDRFAVTHPRWEPYARKPQVRICAGGAR